MTDPSHDDSHDQSRDDSRDDSHNDSHDERDSSALDSSPLSLPSSDTSTPEASAQYSSEPEVIITPESANTRGWAVGQNIDVDALFQEWSQEDELSPEELEIPRRFSVGRSPIMLITIATLAAVLSFYSAPIINALINADQYEPCDRDVTFAHHLKCEMSTYVASSYIVAVGRASSPEDPDELKRHEGMSYVVQLHLNRDRVKFLSQDEVTPRVMSEGQVYAIIPAHAKSVATRFRAQGDLAGFWLTAPDQLNRGLVVDPALDRGYQHLERELRESLGIPYREKLFFFDLTYDPWDEIMKIIVAFLAPLIMLMSLLAFKNEITRRRVLRELNDEDDLWMREFERAGATLEHEDA